MNKNEDNNKRKRYDERLDDDGMGRWRKSTEEAKYSDWSLDAIIPTTEIDTITSTSTCTILPTTTATTSTIKKILSTYSVHRYILAQQSEYFKNILGFGQSSFSESNSKRSPIEMPSPAVTLEHFESLLDYLYSYNKEEKSSALLLNPHNTVVMVYFGDYLQIKQ